MFIKFLDRMDLRPKHDPFGFYIEIFDTDFTVIEHKSGDNSYENLFHLIIRPYKQRNLNVSKNLKLALLFVYNTEINKKSHTLNEILRMIKLNFPMYYDSFRDFKILLD